MTSRRDFIQRTGAAVAGLGGLATAGAWAAAPAPALSFDLHTHPGVFFRPNAAGQTPADSVLGTVRGMNAGGLTGAFFSIVSDAALIRLTPTGVQTQGSYAPGEGWAEYRRQLGVINQLLGRLPVRRATRAADLGRAVGTGRVAAYLACEGGECLDGSVDRVDELHHDGVRSIQLVHYVPSVLGDLQTQPAQHGGLSALGKAVVRRMNAARMLIDVAHASFETVRDVAALTSAPIMLSHSILKREDDRLLAARAITPEHAKLVAGTGGVIGAWPSGFNRSFDEFADHTMRLIEVAGIDHVALGTDMDGNLKPVFTSYADLPRWAAALAARGLAAEEVAKVLGGNVERVLKQVIG